VYKAGITMDVVIEELKRCVGTQLDPRYVEDMVHVLENGFVADENRETMFDNE
jgi:energy-coupling factor transport system substrate-specific component